jgi:hypothetical protein
MSSDNSEGTEIRLRVFNARTAPPPDKSLVVAWRNDQPIPRLVQYRKRKGGYYSHEMPVNPDFYCFLGELTNEMTAAELADAWAERDRKS